MSEIETDRYIDEDQWQFAAACKTSIPGSNPGGASNSKFPVVKHLKV